MATILRVRAALARIEAGPVGDLIGAVCLFIALVGCLVIDWGLS